MINVVTCTSPRLPHLARAPLLVLLGLTITLFVPDELQAETIVANPLTVVQTIGADDDDVLLYNPSWVRFADDGSIFVLNEGDCQVLQFSAEWELLNKFGRCGEGPGEFSNPTGMILYRNEVLVFELARITVYTLDGRYLRTVASRNQYAAAEVIDDRIHVRLGAGDRPGAWLDENYSVVEYFGFDCPDNFVSDFRQCRNVQILPHPEGVCLMANLLTSQVSVIGKDGYSRDNKFIIDAMDNTAVIKDNEGESVGASMSFCMGYGCCDARGRYWLPVYMSEDQPAAIAVLDKDLKTIMPIFNLPDDLFPWMIFESPSGHLLLVAMMESTIYVCDVAEELD